MSLKETRAKYYLAHRESLRKTRAKYYLDHREKILADRKKWYKDNREKSREYYRKWYRINGRSRSVNYAEAIREWKERYPEKVRASRLLVENIRLGKIVRPLKCERCSRKIRIVGHHDDYSKPLEVRWLCNSCHKLIHLSQES